VNDAPALKKADIGVAMGITGTEVSKGAAVMILTDDNFATIVKAVEFGRAIYVNLRNYLLFAMTSMVAFIASYLLAAIFFILGGTPFTPLVALWVKFPVQIPVALALGFDNPPPDLMEKKPRPLKETIISSSQWVRIAFLGIVRAIGTLFLEGYYKGSGEAVAASMGFVVFSLYIMATGLSARSETASAFNRDIFHNRNQLMLYGISLLSVILALRLDFLQEALGLTRLTGEQWFICIVFAFVFLLIDEVIKFFLRRRRRNKSV
jgi:Ca2+-transporting ATPase